MSRDDYREMASEAVRLLRMVTLDSMGGTPDLFWPHGPDGGVTWDEFDEQANALLDRWDKLQSESDRAVPNLEWHEEEIDDGQMQWTALSRVAYTEDGDRFQWVIREMDTLSGPRVFTAAHSDSELRDALRGVSWMSNKNLSRLKRLCDKADRILYEGCLADDKHLPAGGTER